MGARFPHEYGYQSLTECRIVKDELYEVVVLHLQSMGAIACVQFITPRWQMRIVAELRVFVDYQLRLN